MQSKDEVAIVGYACRLPGARHSRELWKLLKNNRCTVTQITPDRFPIQGFHHPSPDQKGRSYTFAAGVIDDVWGFDASAFGMSPREAEQVDPQHRHLLEVTFDALAHAGIRPSSLAGTDTGVYVGVSSVDHATRFFADPTVADVHMMTGNSLSIMSNRISYTLDLRGPSLSIDTACSSSLVALHLASEAIRNGTIDTAIVAGANLILSPYSYVGFSRASMLSPTGLCRPFDAGADGYVRAEGVVAVVLRSIQAAHRSRNHIHSVVVGSAMNQDGRTTGMSLPSAESQRALLESIYSEFSVDPADLLFVEAHGTGTQVGDPIEADALGKGLGQQRARPLPIGSIKSNVGHLEPVSGLAGLLKTVMALNHGMVPATLHHKSPSPNIAFDELNLRVIDRNWRPSEQQGSMLAGVNSFGFGGTNAHAILRREAATERLVYLRANAPPPPLLITAHNSDGVASLAKAFDMQWPRERRAVPEFIGAAAYLRDALPHRALIRGGTAEEIRRNVREFAEKGTAPSVLTGQALGNELPVTFLFSGNGSQWSGMGRRAWQGNVHFREALTEIDGHFRKVQAWSIVDELFAENLADRLRRATYSQPLLLALQVATVRALEQSGLTASAVMGHSVGEVSAAWASGALSLEQAIDVVIARSRHQESTHGTGSMAALMLSEREARRFLKMANAQEVDVAAINSWRSVTVSGPTPEIDRLLAAAEKARVSARRLDLDYPFHSALVDPVRAPLLRELEGLKPHANRRKLVSSVTGEAIDGQSLSAEHWWRNVRDPVQFDSALACLLNDGYRVFVEVGPRPVLTSYVRDVLREKGNRGIVVEAMNDADGPQDPLELAVARVLLAGGKIDQQRVFGPPPATAVLLPLYPWQHTPFKMQPTIESSMQLIDVAHPLLGQRPRFDSAEWFSIVDPVLFPWLQDHKVGGVAVFPATAYVEAVLAAASEILGSVALELRDFDIVRPIIFDGRTSHETKVRFSVESGLAEFYSRLRGGLADWSLNARGIVRRSPITAKLVTPAGTGPVTVKKARIYECAQELGFTYGLAFQRMQQVSYPHPKRAVAPLDPPSFPIEGAYVTDLTAFDSAFHTLFATEEAGVADQPMTRMVPIRLGCVRLYKPGVVAKSVIVRTVRQSPTSITLDIELRDDKGDIVLAADEARLIEAPADALTDPAALGYRTTAWHLDREGKASRLIPLRESVAPTTNAPASLDESLLLLEAGCLRSAWQALAVADEVSADEAVTATWREFYRAGLLWHLELRNLAHEKDGKLVPSLTCDLPQVASILGSLTVRHPTMTVEATSLARIDEILGRLLSADPDAIHELTSAHWRNLGLASSQTQLLRQSVVGHLNAIIEQADDDRLFRVLMVGSEHLTAGHDLINRFGNLELLVTDVDPGRLEQARLAAGDSEARIRWVAWTSLGELAPRSIDLAFAIDALSEVAAFDGGLASVIRVLRPGAPVVAGELSPSLFWDIVRGTKATWWARSANPAFPVGALLTRQEWIDELDLAGMRSASASSVVDGTHIGIFIQAIAPAAAPDESSGAESVFSWEGDDASESKGNVQLRSRVAERLGEQPPDLASPARPTTDIVWTIAAMRAMADPMAVLTRHLAGIAARCRRIGDTVRRLWILIEFDQVEDVTQPLALPVWTSVTSAMRVAQNEYAGLQIRCLGLADTTASTIDRTADELMAPEADREIFVSGAHRTIVRIRRGATARAVADAAPDADHTAIGLSPRAEHGRLAWITEERSFPKVGEIEVKVAATGLNFRDVMWNLRLLPEEALEEGYAGASLGMECAGIVTRVGANVDTVRLGDKVVGFAAHAFRSHVVAPAFTFARMADDLTFDAASTIPVAFLTAYYSLLHLSRLKGGETVLIHGGAGAVGLAAVQIARLVGARIVATAGSEEKRAFLRHYGVDFVCNSRTLTFADEINAYTNGKGVDVVLNSLAGEAMSRSMDCLRPFGRFVELGKRDFYANTHLGLRPLRRNLSYFGVDIDQLIAEHRDVACQLFGEIIGFFSTGQLVALPHRVFVGERVDDAFRLMQRSGHVGKIVIRPPASKAARGQMRGAFPVGTQGTHVIIGGTSGFGLATAGWLADRGARHVVLASRSGRVSEGDQAELDKLRRKGVGVSVESVDVADEATLRQLLRGVSEVGAVKGIVHAAMVIDDRLIEGIDADAIETVLRPKITGALNLERIAADLDLDYLLLYSSATTMFGNPGQFNYVAANGFMEGLARQMQARGLPAIAVSWGGIEDAGYISRNIATDSNLRKRFSSSLISAQTALDGLDWAFDQAGRPATAHCALARINWSLARHELAVVRTPIFGSLGATSGSRQSGESAAILEKLRGLSVDVAADALVEIVVEEIARVLRLPPKEIDRHRPLSEIGMDSLMMLELRNVVEGVLQVDLPMMSLSSGITPVDVARRIAPLVTGEQKQTVPSALAAITTSHFAEEIATTTIEEQNAAVDAVLGRLHDLSN
jgi:acyl transferase domain-containing protein/NADPH:quinone reductase-like Zn-dependent oxidoreductase